MGALANPEVGRYLQEHCVPSYVKVGTFRAVNGRKQGGNVASYFTLLNGAVLHVVPGPVDAATLLREARWVVETRKLAVALCHGDEDKYKEFFRKAHLERLAKEHRTALGQHAEQELRNLTALTDGWTGSRLFQRLSNQGRAHLLLAAQPLAPVDQIYDVVFERILGEKVSTLPVVRR